MSQTKRMKQFANPVPPPLRGKTTISVSAAAGATVGVLFPAGRYSQAPHSVQLTKTDGRLAKYIPYYTALSAAGFTLGIYAGDGSSASGSVEVAWQVVE